MPTYVRSAIDKFPVLIAFLGKFPSYAKPTAQESRIKMFTPVSLASKLSSKLQYLNYGPSRTAVSTVDPPLPGWRMIPGSRKVTTT